MDLVHDTGLLAKVKSRNDSKEGRSVKLLPGAAKVLIKKRSKVEEVSWCFVLSFSGVQLLRF